MRWDRSGPIQMLVLVLPSFRNPSVILYLGAKLWFLRFRFIRIWIWLYNPNSRELHVVMMLNRKIFRTKTNRNSQSLSSIRYRWSRWSIQSITRLNNPNKTKLRLLVLVMNFGFYLITLIQFVDLKTRLLAK